MSLISSTDRPNIKLCMKKREPNAGGDNCSQRSVFNILETLVEDLVNRGIISKNHCFYIP